MGIQKMMCDLMRKKYKIIAYSFIRSKPLYNNKNGGTLFCLNQRALRFRYHRICPDFLILFGDTTNKANCIELV